MDGFVVHLEENNDPAVIGAVIKGLTAYIAAQADGDVPNHLVLSVRDAQGDVVGGLVGATYLGWLSVHAVWVSDTARHTGCGTELMRQAEAVAVQRGCPRVFLETLSFQALPFYEKLGYQVVSTLADFPPGGMRYALTRML